MLVQTEIIPPALNTEQVLPNKYAKKMLSCQNNRATTCEKKKQFSITLPNFLTGAYNVPSDNPVQWDCVSVASL